MNGNIIFNDKQARILLSLRNQQQKWYISTLAKACDATYVHTCNFIKTCEQHGLVENEKHGKIKEIRLTEKGAQVAESISKIYGLIGPQAPQQKPEQKTAPSPQTEKK